MNFSVRRAFRVTKKYPSGHVISMTGFAPEPLQAERLFDEFVLQRAILPKDLLRHQTTVSASDHLTLRISPEEVVSGKAGSWIQMPDGSQAELKRRSTTVTWPW